MTAAARSAYASGVSVERQPSQHRNEGNLPVFSALYVRSSLDARITSTLGMGGGGFDERRARCERCSSRKQWERESWCCTREGSRSSRGGSWCPSHSLSRTELKKIVQKASRGKERECGEVSLPKRRKRGEKPTRRLRGSGGAGGSGGLLSGHIGAISPGRSPNLTGTSWTRARFFLSRVASARESTTRGMSSYPQVRDPQAEGAPPRRT